MGAVSWSSITGITPFLKSASGSLAGPRQRIAARGELLDGSPHNSSQTDGTVGSLSLHQLDTVSSGRTERGVPK